MLNAVRIPEGVDDATVRGGLLERFGIEIGGGLGAFKGKVWRIGLMGYGSRPANVFVLLAALEQLLAEQKHRFEHGSSIAAATAVYAARSSDCDRESYFRLGQRLHFGSRAGHQGAVVADFQHGAVRLVERAVVLVGVALQLRDFFGAPAASPGKSVAGARPQRTCVPPRRHEARTRTRCRCVPASGRTARCERSQRLPVVGQGRGDLRRAGHGRIAPAIAHGEPEGVVRISPMRG